MTEKSEMLALAERLSDAVADLQGEIEAMGGTFDPCAWKLDIQVTDLQQAVGALRTAAASAEPVAIEYARRLNNIAVICELHGEAGNASDLRLIAQYLATHPAPVPASVREDDQWRGC